MMQLTKDEQTFLFELVKHRFEAIVNESKTIMDHPTPTYLAGEQRYEEFLKTLLEKLKK